MFNSSYWPASRLLMVILGLLLSVAGFAQNANHADELDVDRLYNIYKNKSEVTVNTGNREITAHILISYNKQNRPYRIIMYGEAVPDMQNSLDELKDELCEAKVKAGYKKIQKAATINFDQSGMYENNVPVTLFQKDTQYAKYGIKRTVDRNELVTDEGTPRFNSDFFYFEVGDTARKAVRTSSKLDF